MKRSLASMSFAVLVSPAVAAALMSPALAADNAQTEFDRILSKAVQDYVPVQTAGRSSDNESSARGGSATGGQADDRTVIAPAR